MPTNVTSILKVTVEDTSMAALPPRTAQPATPVGIPSAATISATSIGINAAGPAGQPVAQANTGITEQATGGDYSAVTRGTSDFMSPAGNLARSEPELDLLHDDESMETSERATGNPEAKEDPFLAPKPMERKTKAEKFSAPDSFREAEMVNASVQKRRRGPSLFERMTGVGRAARKAEVEADEAQSALREEEQHPVRTSQPAANNIPTAQAPQTAPQAPSSTSSAPAAAPPTAPMPAAAPDGPETVAKKQAEEDLLDIPAFLRRQAN